MEHSVIWYYRLKREEKQFIQCLLLLTMLHEIKSNVDE